MDGLVLDDVQELMNSELGALMARAAELRDSVHGRIQSYSPKVFIPLTHLCRDVCHYCTFARPPRRGGWKRSGWPANSACPSHRAS